MNVKEKRPVWPEAEIIAEPVKNAGEPQVLVRRRGSGLVGPDVDVAYFTGAPCISLFTGCGGMDIGIERSGFETVLQHEWNGTACETLIANRPNFFRHAALIQGDITKTPTSLILKEAGLEVGEPSLVCGGPPCQGFSTSNSNRKRSDKRNDLVFEFLRVVTEAKPKFFMFENVPGFVHFLDGEYPKKFLKAAFNAYYELVYGLCNAAEYGVPQDRCRFICMGTRKDLAQNKGKIAGLPKPEFFGKRDIARLNKIEKSPLVQLLNLSPEADLLRMAPGVRYFPDRPFICNPDPTGHLEGRSSGFLKFFAKLKAEEPDRLVTTP